MKEPVAIAGAVQVVLTALVSVLVAFNAWHPTDDQIAALTAFYAAGVVLVTMFVRSKVTPTTPAGGE